MAKKSTYECVSDRISSLPDPILCHVLSFLPGKEAVRSSLLSSRWRYLFTLMSTFDFRSPVTGENINKFKYFVDRLFFYPNQISLECFRVNDFWVKDDSLKEDCLRLCGWICAALWRGVKELDVEVELGMDEEDLELPTFLFTSQSLVTLKLAIGYKPMDVPTNISLPNLKTLHLSGVIFRGGSSIHRLIYSLHVLEDLVIHGCRFDDTTELHIHNLSLKRLVLQTLYSGVRYFDRAFLINAPSLVYFRYFGLVVVKAYTLRNMDSLQNAHIGLRGYFPARDRVRIVTQLLQGICNVRSLYLTLSDGFETLPRMLIDERLAFRNLVELTFRGGDYDDGWKGAWLLEFLQCVPNLKTLIMSLAVPEEEFRDLPEEVPSCLSFHLKEITIEDFKEDTHMFELVSYFLSNAIVLEKLVLRKGNMSEENKMRVLDNLSSFPKKSKKCQVLIC